MLDRTSGASDTSDTNEHNVVKTEGKKYYEQLTWGTGIIFGI